MRPWLPLLSSTLLVLLFAACGAGGNASKPPTSEPPTPSDALAIHNVDFTQVAAVKSLQAQVGGQIDTQAVQFSDVTNDGRDDAIVPIASGGTLGNIAYVVLTLRNGAPVSILTAVKDRASTGGVSLSMQDGRLVKTVGKYAAEDPLCCPSVLVNTTYRFDGTNLQVESEKEVQLKGGKQ